MSQQTLKIEGMTCAACQIHVQRALEAVPGVETASVNLMAHTALIDATQPIDTATLISAVRNSGYGASLPIAQATHLPPPGEMDMEGGRLGFRAALALLTGAVAMTLSMPLMMLQTHTGDPLLTAIAGLMAPIMPHALMQLPAQPLRWFLCVLALGTMLFAAPEIYAAAWRAARHRTTNMNTLIALGTLAAFASSLAATITPGSFASHGIAADVYYEAVILILAFLLTGRWLEARARNRATQALRGFASLQPSDARLLTLSREASATDYAAASETLLPLDAIEAGDVIRVLAGDQIPLDGIILQGRSSIDESMLTGEPLPVTRTVDERVSGGTMNLDGVLIVRATAVGAASTLAQMQRLLDQAQSSRAPMQRLADRASAIFVPTVLGLATITFIAWAIAGNTMHHHDGYSRAFSIAIAVLIIACPCAMGLAVPAAITVSLGRAAQAGLLIKGGEALEHLATVDTLALDKTGTLTLGRPQIAGFALAAQGTLDERTILSYAMALERLSTHPLATAVVAYAEQRKDLPTAPVIENSRVLPGTGLTATIAGHTLAIGNASLLNQPLPELAQPASLTHATPLYVLLDNKPQAVFFATDAIRPSAPQAMEQLRALQIRPLLLTGDIESSAAPIATTAGIEDVRAGLLPQQKLDAIRNLQTAGHRVAMAGDGLNDAAALAQSDAGFAMPSGTDLAREAGDILLLHPDLRLLPTAFRLARRTTRVMRQNLAWALIYNITGLPIAAGVLYPRFHVLLSPVLASAAMALSSVSVLANSLRLRRLPEA